MVVTLDLESHGHALTEVDDACVLARPLEDAGALAREALQEQRRMLVAAMFRPEQGKDGQLEVVRTPLE
jgi:hypothetical protein